MKKKYDTIFQLAAKTLDQLITPQGIYASSNKGEAGRYHALFGRDSVITAAFVIKTEEIRGTNIYTQNAAQSVVKLGRWQGEKTNSYTGEEPGKIPHEVWEDSSQVHHLVEGRKEAGLKPFYVDFLNKSYVNWFSNDSTPLWVNQVIQLHNKSVIPANKELNTKLLKALKWCLKNISDNNGFAGYSYDAGSPYLQPAIQSWKDSEGAFLYEDGKVPLPPVKDVGVNAVMWSALQAGSLYFEEHDSSFSKELSDSAAQLKKRFNSYDGFLMKDDISDYYFSDALDGKNKQLKGISSDPFFALWSTVEGVSIIDKIYIPNIVKRIMSEDFFNSEAGVRVYSNRNKVFDPEEYHRGAETYWPFISGIVGWGLHNYGYHSEARQVCEAMLKGVSRFESCIEMFLKKNGEYCRYVNPQTKQVSSSDQAWTAGAVVFAVNYLNG
jgi:glycogen debranching enzyme